VAKVEWHPGELCPSVGFIVSNLARSAEHIVAFYNHHGTCEQRIKGGKGAINWTRLSRRSFASAVRPSAPRRYFKISTISCGPLTMPRSRNRGRLTSLREKLIKIGGKVVSHGRYVTFQMAGVAVSWHPVRRKPVAHRPVARTAVQHAAAMGSKGCDQAIPLEKVCHDGHRAGKLRQKLGNPGNTR
jgi:hypothetical protein